MRAVIQAGFSTDLQSGSMIKRGLGLGYRPIHRLHLASRRYSGSQTCVRVALGRSADKVGPSVAGACGTCLKSLR
jgi:hypothetical protein